MNIKKVLLGAATSALMFSAIAVPAFADDDGPVCIETGFYRDGINMTAKLMNPEDVPETVDATGCNIGVYYGPGEIGTISHADIYGANYYGVVNHEADVSIVGSNIHDIGEGFGNGLQHGVGIYFANVVLGEGNQPACDLSEKTTTGEIKDNTIFNYQKGGIVINCAGAKASIEGNTITGAGPVPWIAQNGIQIGRGATGSILNNKISGNYYTGDTWKSAGVLFYQPLAGTVLYPNRNDIHDNQMKFLNFGRTSHAN